MVDAEVTQADWNPDSFKDGISTLFPQLEVPKNGFGPHF